MAKIKVISERPLYDGMAITFNAPCDCSAVDGLLVCYNDVPCEFTFRDAHGNDLAGLGNLFAEGALVKVILNTETNKAFIQNADTNAYLEAQLAGKAPAGYGLGEVSSKWVSTPDLISESGFYRSVAPSVSSGNAWYLCISYTEQYKTVFGFKEDTGGLAFMRTMKAGVWGEWEWVNPPMLPGVEYRTTERRAGKAVYAKAIDFGEIPVNSSKNVEYSLGATTLVDGWVIMNGNTKLPYAFGEVSVVINNILINGTRITGTGNSAGSTAVIYLKYTKD